MINQCRTNTLAICQWQLIGQICIQKFPSDDTQSEIACVMVVLETIIENVVGVLLSGLSFSCDFSVTIARVVVMALVVVSFTAVFFVDTVKKKLIFAGCIAGFVFIFKLLLFILNRIVDRSVECYPEEEETQEPANAKEEEKQKPANAEEEETGSVAEFYIEDSNEEEADVKTDNLTYVKCCGNTCACHFSRRSLNAAFPGNFEIVYVFVAAILSGLMAFTCTFMLQDMTIGSAVWGIMICGGAVYSTLQPREVEAYSLTVGDPYNGITRCYSLLVICGVWKLSEFISSDVVTTSLPFFEIVIDWPAIHEYVDFVCKWGLLLFPIWMFFFIGHPYTMIAWILEWLGRYLFGLGGSRSIVHSIVQLLRSGIAAVVFGLAYHYWKNKWGNCLMIAVSSLILQVPFFSTNYSSLTKFQIFLSFVDIFVLALISFVAAIVGQYVPYRISTYVTLSFSVLFDLIWPYVLSYSQYATFIFRLLPFQSRVVEAIRVLTGIWLAPMMLSSLLMAEPSCPVWFTSVVLVCTLNRALAEPDIFAIAMIIAVLGEISELNGLRFSLILFLSMGLARKMMFVIPTLRYFLTKLNWPLVPEEYSILGQLFIVYHSVVLGMDKMMDFWTLLWSIITGAPMLSLNINGWFIIPSSPRPNSFWTTHSSSHMDSNQTPSDPLASTAYVALAHQLSSCLGALVRSGKLGIVDSNDFLLFHSEKLNCFVHIIAREPHGVSFQIRGMEIRSTTICHNNENRLMSAITDIWYDRGPFARMLLSIRAAWLLKNYITLATYEYTTVEMSTCFVGIGKTMKEVLAYLALLYTISRMDSQDRSYMRDDLLGREVDDDGYSSKLGSPRDVTTLLSLFDTKDINDDLVRQVVAFWKDFINAMNNSTDPTPFILDNYLCKVRPPLSMFVARLWQKVTGFMVVAWSLCSMQLGPDFEVPDELPEGCMISEMFESSLGEIREFFDGVNNDFVVSLPGSMNFWERFIQSTPCVVILTEILDEDTMLENPHVVFFRNGKLEFSVFSIHREGVRRAWTSDAYSQSFLGEGRSERANNQAEGWELHNLLIQSANPPFGYPAVLGPIQTSYSFPPNLTLF